MSSSKLSSSLQTCTRCVMNTTDPNVTFDEKGECSHCQKFDRESPTTWFPDTPEGEKRLAELIDKIKKDGQGKEYDCIIGLSGGIDSSFLAYKASTWGLRILAVHVDAGWNSELAVQNIESIVSKCGIDLYTHVVDWEAMKDIHYAMFKAGVANQDVAQDHAFFAALYDFAVKNKVKWVMNGFNYATESTRLPLDWGYRAMDAKHIRGIHKIFGRDKNAIKNFPLIGLYKLYIYYNYVKKMKVARPLNYMHYDKRDAFKELEAAVGYKYYGTKHSESRFTKFFQNHYLPEKFGFDKRIFHLSSLIHSGQMTREEAVTELAKPNYDPKELAEDITYFCKKLGMSQEEYQAIMAAPPHDYSEYPSDNFRFEMLKKLSSMFNLKA